jgi:hypothetical protein
MYNGGAPPHALMLKSRILGENPCNVEKIFRLGRVSLCAAQSPGPAQYRPTDYAASPTDPRFESLNPDLTVNPGWLATHVGRRGRRREGLRRSRRGVSANRATTTRTGLYFIRVHRRLSAANALLVSALVSLRPTKSVNYLSTDFRALPLDAKAEPSIAAPVRRITPYFRPTDTGRPRAD